MRPVLNPHEIADLRAAADRADYESGRQMYALLDAYLDCAERDEEEVKLLEEQVEELEKERAEARDQVRSAQTAVGKLRARLYKPFTYEDSDELLDLLGDIRGALDEVVL